MLGRQYVARSWRPLQCWEEAHPRQPGSLEIQLAVICYPTNIEGAPPKGNTCCALNIGEAPPKGNLQQLIHISE